MYIHLSFIVVIQLHVSCVSNKLRASILEYLLQIICVIVREFSFIAFSFPFDLCFFNMLYNYANVDVDVDLVCTLVSNHFLFPTRLKSYSND